MLQKVSQVFSQNENNDTITVESNDCQSTLRNKGTANNGKTRTTKESKHGKSKKQDMKDSVSQLYNPIDVLNTIKQLGERAVEAVKYCEEQETERERIRAQRDREIEIIRAQRDMIMSYLDKSFDERRMIFDKQFKALDKAISNGDIQLVSVTLESINQLAASSPFKALADIQSVKGALEQPGSTFDI